MNDRRASSARLRPSLGGLKYRFADVSLSTESLPSVSSLERTPRRTCTALCGRFEPHRMARLAVSPARLAERRRLLVAGESEGFPVDHDYPGPTADAMTLAKLWYLAKLERDRMDWSTGTSSLGAEASALSKLLGSVPMTIATFDRWWSLERVGLRFEDLKRVIENVPLDVLKRIEGPRERSPLAEEAAREEERRNVQSEFDEVTGLPRSAVTWERPGLSEWPLPVGTWWDEIIAERAHATESRPASKSTVPHAE